MAERYHKTMFVTVPSYFPMFVFRTLPCLMTIVIPLPDIVSRPDRSFHFVQGTLRAGQGRGGLSGRITMKFGEETGAEETNDR